MRIAWLLVLSLLISSVVAQEFAVMTYNLRLDTPDDGINSWPYRRGAVAALLQDIKPAFLGTQEGFKHQLDYLDSALVRMQYLGVGRDDGNEGGEYSALFYDSTRFILDGPHGTFWLSASPDSVSYSWDANYRRICTYGLFASRMSGQQIWVFNTHFDHVAQLSRRNSAQLIINRISEAQDSVSCPVLLLGDFNAMSDSEPILIVKQSMQDAYDVAEIIQGDPRGTFTGWDKTLIPDRRIDYVFVRGLDVIWYRHIETRRSDGEFLSDHLPVVAGIRMPVK